MGRKKPAQQLLGEAKQSSTLRAALAQLLEAHRLAESSGRPAADFAIELPNLVLSGSSPAALKWLVSSNLAQHLAAGKHLSSRGARTRLAFSDTSRFALTKLGLQLAWAVAKGPESRAPGKPRFDKSALELRYRGRLLMEVPARAEYRIIV